MVRDYEGKPQGALISPLLANVYLHYVLDLWAQQWRSRHTKGDVIIMRYADDFVPGFQDRWEAQRFLKELQDRLGYFGLSLHPDKTRLIEFGPHAEPRRRRLGKGKPKTFDFLGFTHICSQTRDGKRFTVGRKTIAKRFRAKLQTVKQQLRRPSIPASLMWPGGSVGCCKGTSTIMLSPAISRVCSLSGRRSSGTGTAPCVVGETAVALPGIASARLRIAGFPRARILHPHPCLRFYAIHPR